MLLASLHLCQNRPIETGTFGRIVSVDPKHTRVDRAFPRANDHPVAARIIIVYVALTSALGTVKVGQEVWAWFRPSDRNAPGNR